MTQRELAGIMAHELAHMNNEDIKVMAIADMVSRFTSMMSTFGIFALLVNLPSILFGGGAAVPMAGDCAVDQERRPSGPCCNWRFHAPANMMQTSAQSC